MLWFSGFSLLLLAACSACRPVLYPNAHYKKVGPEQAEKDIQTAIEMARSGGLDATPASHRTLAKSATKTAANTGVSAAVGVASGSAGAGTAIGAAGNGLGFLIDWMFVKKAPDPVFKRHVELTLSQQGYQVLGWK
ncbi:MAG: hypothetical protein PHV82_14505 [Victivallaceae bacterium]|nr:hypothetical protein [Victivallaceae bacterium]